MTPIKIVYNQYTTDFGEFERSPLCGNAFHPVFPGGVMCRSVSEAVAEGQGATAPVTGSEVF